MQPSYPLPFRSVTYDKWRSYEGCSPLCSYRNSLGTSANSALSLPFKRPIRMQMSTGVVSKGPTSNLLYLTKKKKGQKEKENNHWKTLSLRPVGKLPRHGRFGCQNTATSHHCRAGLQDCKHFSGKCSEHRVKKVLEINRVNVLWQINSSSILGACSDSRLFFLMISYDYLDLDVDRVTWGCTAQQEETGPRLTGLWWAAMDKTDSKPM